MNETSPKMFSCRNCAMYLRTGVDVGECHAAPPQVVAVPQQTTMGVTMTTLGVFPPTKPTNWCGQWLPVTKFEVVENKPTKLADTGGGAL